jgi:2-polyprenyl-3-methyl-5-hydroxy-6-metoxy-1,4-benzoquinol methylase
MNCKICENSTELLFNQKVLQKHDVKYYKCSSCELIFTEEPHWLEEAYSESINLNDTGLISRSIEHSRLLSTIIFFFFDRKKQFLDYAGGYGVLVRLMRDLGFDYLWDDLYTKNLHAVGFEHKENKNYDLISTIECFEHLVDPNAEMEKILKLGSSIYFSTEIAPSKNPKPNEWNYYGFDHGQHIMFYSVDTLKFMATKFGLNLYTDGKKYHLFSKKKFWINPILLAKLLDKFGFSKFLKPLMKKQRKKLNRLEAQYLKELTSTSST